MNKNRGHAYSVMDSFVAKIEGNNNARKASFKRAPGGQTYMAFGIEFLVGNSMQVIARKL